MKTKILKRLWLIELGFDIALFAVHRIKERMFKLREFDPWERED